MSGDRSSPGMPIILYQMGKVGSTSLYKLLQGAGFSGPIYRINFLSDEGIREAEEFHGSLGNVIEPVHLQRSRELRRKMDRLPDRRWNVVTLVREPISRDISQFFHYMQMFHPRLVDASSNVDKGRALRALAMKFKHFDESVNYTCTWFGKEFRKSLNIDVYSYPFDHRKGYTIILGRQARILTVRLEDLDRCINDAMGEFLGESLHFPIVQANRRSEQKYGPVYEKVLQELQLERTVCERIYSTQYAAHFYTASERRRLIERWSNGSRDP